MKKLLIVLIAVISVTVMGAVEAAPSPQGNIIIWNNSTQPLTVQYIDCTSDLPFTSCTNPMTVKVAANNVAPALYVAGNQQGVATLTGVFNSAGQQVGTFAAGNCKGFWNSTQQWTIIVNMRPDNVATCSNSNGSN